MTADKLPMKQDNNEVMKSADGTDHVVIFSKGHKNAVNKAYDWSMVTERK